MAQRPQYPQCTRLGDFMGSPFHWAYIRVRLSCPQSLRKHTTSCRVGGCLHEIRHRRVQLGKSIREVPWFHRNPASMNMAKYPGLQLTSQIDVWVRSRHLISMHVKGLAYLLLLYTSRLVFLTGIYIYTRLWVLDTPLRCHEAHDDCQTRSRELQQLLHQSARRP